MVDKQVVNDLRNLVSRTCEHVLSGNSHHDAVRSWVHETLLPALVKKFDASIEKPVRELEVATQQALEVARKSAESEPLIVTDAVQKIGKE